MRAELGSESCRCSAEQAYQQNCITRLFQPIRPTESTPQESTVSISRLTRISRVALVSPRQTAYSKVQLRHIVSDVFTPVLAKHPKHLSLMDILAVGVDRTQRTFEPMKKQVEAWEAVNIDCLRRSGTSAWTG